MTAPDPAEAELFPWPDGNRAAVCLTFDDARASQIDRGAPVLDDLGARATFYVSPRQVEARLDDWKAMVAAGHEIGNHTMTHPCSGNFPFARGRALEDMTLERMEANLLAQDAIASRLGVAPTTFAYPCGQTFVGRGREVRSYVPLVAEHFLVGRSAFDEHHNDPAFCDLAQVYSMEGDTRDAEDLIRLVDKAADAGGWLVLFGHEIGDEVARQVTRVEALTRFCEHCKARGDIWLDTMAAVGEHVRTVRGE